MFSFLRGQRGWFAAEGRTGLNVDEEGTREAGRAVWDGLAGEAKRDGVRGKANGLDAPFWGLGEAAPDGTRDRLRVYRYGLSMLFNASK